MITPSSNTALEPLTCRILAGLPDVTVHFARFRVTEIGLDQSAMAQFDDDRILEAARLLADAKMDVIGWSGTSAGWRGFHTDEQLCQRIHEQTGVPAITSVLALNEIMRTARCHSFGLVTPYTEDVQTRIIGHYQQAGFRCVAERHVGLRDNFSFAEVSEATLARLVHDVAAARPDAVVTLCTNLWAAHLVPDLERALGLPVFDSVATVLWKALAIGGIDASPIAPWGRLFSDVKPAASPRAG